MKKSNYTYLTQTQFAEEVGVSQPAVSKGLRTGKIVWSYKEDGRKDGINPDDSVNKAYINKINTRNDGNRLEVQAAKAIIKGAGAGGGDDAELKAAMTANKTSDAKLKEIDQAIKLTKLAEAQKKVIPKEFVVFFWNRVCGDMQNYILGAAARVSAEITAMFRTSDPTMELKVKERIEEELISGLALVSRNAEAVPGVLGLSPEDGGGLATY